MIILEKERSALATVIGSVANNIDSSQVRHRQREHGDIELIMSFIRSETVYIDSWIRDSGRENCIFEPTLTHLGMSNVEKFWKLIHDLKHQEIFQLGQKMQLNCENFV